VIFFGRPPFLPLARDAAAFASDFTFPPNRPRATAAGCFLRGDMLRVPACDVLGGERRNALHGQSGDLGGEALEGGDVASGESGLPAGQEFAADAVGVHTPIKANRLGIVNRENHQ
jgi:hypothetical protein